MDYDRLKIYKMKFNYGNERKREFLQPISSQGSFFLKEVHPNKLIQIKKKKAKQTFIFTTSENLNSTDFSLCCLLIGKN